MGHVEPGGEASGPYAHAVWPLWKQLTRHFPTWSLLPSSLTTPGAWTYLGVDFVSGFRRNRSTRQVFDLLRDVGEADLDALSALADLNARRQDQMLRAVVVGYLTIPLSVIAVLAEVAGESLLGFVRDHRDLTIQIGVAALSGPLAFFLSHWRSRQIVGVLDLVRIERGRPAHKPPGSPEA